jgi:hypothetical protein
MPESKLVKSPRNRRKGSNSNGPRGLRFYLYAVSGTLHGERGTFHVVCCHASDARALIAARQPEIDKLRVTRGRPVHFIAIGDHSLLE